MMPTELKLQGSRISLHLISVFLPKQEFDNMCEHVLSYIKASRREVNATHRLS